MQQTPVLLDPIALEWLARDLELALVRFDPCHPVPPWVDGDGVVSVTRSDRELSIIVPLARVPSDLAYEGPFVAARVSGQLPLGLIGVLVRILAPLSQASVPIVALSTFDTDYILVRAEHRERASAAWRSAGFVIG